MDTYELPSTRRGSANLVLAAWVPSKSVAIGLSFGVVSVVFGFVKDNASRLFTHLARSSSLSHASVILEVPLDITKINFPPLPLDVSTTRLFFRVEVL